MKRASSAALSAANAGAPKVSSRIDNRQNNRIGNVRLPAFRRPREQIAHSVVTELGKIFVELADTAKPIRRKERDRLIRGSLDFAERWRRTNRDCGYDLRRIFLPKSRDCGQHRCARSQTVVDENDDTSFQGRCPPAVAIIAL